MNSAASDRDLSVATLRRTYKSGAKLVQVRTWTRAVELEVLRLADGAMLAAADDLPNVNHLSDEDFMKLILD